MYVVSIYLLITRAFYPGKNTLRNEFYSLKCETDINFEQQLTKESSLRVNIKIPITGQWLIGHEKGNAFSHQFHISSQLWRLCY